MFNSNKNLDKLNNIESVTEALTYIDNYWSQLTRIQTSSTDTLFGLPKPYIVPTDQHDNFRFNEQYYWDSYFISVGLIECGKNEIAEGMLNNLFYMYKHFKMIPSANRLYMTSRSQPPLLTSYILLIYNANKKSKVWLKQAVKIAHEEYLNVWMGELHPHWRQVYKGLSRYYDINDLHDLAEAESGWDMTTRFNRKALDYLPIDLNSLLFKYEVDFALIANILGEKQVSALWLKKAKKRQKKVNQLMWNNVHNFYFDYNYNKENLGQEWSLAAFYTMWAGLASKEQAANLVKNLRHFEHDGGLSATGHNLIDMSIFGSLKTQWSYPNGWAPLHYIVIEGLENYGYKQQADRIAKKWLSTNLNWFNKHGDFLEKYNVINPEKMPTDGVYPTQVGFGWTNAIFVYLANRYLSK